MPCFLYYRSEQETRKFEKYVGYPVMRTFCTPAKDGIGALVSLVFVAAAAVSLGVSDAPEQRLLLGSVFCLSIVGQLISGLAWVATGISKENFKNKKMAAGNREKHQDEPTKSKCRKQKSLACGDTVETEPDTREHEQNTADQISCTTKL